MSIRIAFPLLVCLVTTFVGCSDSPPAAEAVPGDSSRKPNQQAVASIKSRKGATADRSTDAPNPKSLARKTQAPANERVTRKRVETTPVAVTRTKKTPSAKEASWASWRGPNANGISDETGLIQRFPEDGPKVLWRANLGSGFSGLAVAGGRVFTLFGEDGREKVVCFNADTGRELWKIDSDSDYAEGRSYGPRAMPVVDGSLVYTVGASGQLFCLRAASGKKVWEMNLYEKFNMRLHEEGLSPTPLVDGKKLIVLVGTAVFALDKTNGKVIWKSLKEKMNHASPKLATIDGRRQLLVLTGSNLVGLSPEDGSELWRHPQRGANNATPVVGPGNRIFTAASYGFGSQLVKIADGVAQQVYKNNVLATHHATAVYYQGHLYGFHDRPGIFKCVDFASGEEKWVSRASGKGKLIIADGQIILISEYGSLMLAPVSAKGFEPTAKFRLVKGTCYTAPSLVGGKLYVRSNKQMACVDMRN